MLKQLTPKLAIAGGSNGGLLVGACMTQRPELFAAALPADDPRVKLLRDSARQHAELGFGYVFSGHYEGDHWLATFAIYLQSSVGQDNFGRE